MTIGTGRVKAIAAAAVVAAWVGVALASSVATATAASGRASGSAALPAHVFAPYFETYAGSNLAALAHRSGSPYLTLAFLETPTRGSCTVDWNGDPATPVAPATFGRDIARIRAAGGDVVPSFGGYSGDHEFRDLADSCTDANAIAREYERVITTYDVTRVDLDVEDRSLKHPEAIERRNQAIHIVDHWAADHGRTIQFVYTLPTGTSGLDPEGVDILRSAARHHARVDVVNIMTFDYYDGDSHEMAADTKTAADAALGQLGHVYPADTIRALWARMGITEMIGIDDFGAAETLTIADARAVKRWAAAKGIAELSFWALQRDNGGCPGSSGRDDCSGVTQSTWQFSKIFEPFTGGRNEKRT